MPRARVLETVLYCDSVEQVAAFYERLLDAAALLRSERLVALDAGQRTVLLLFQRGQSIHPVAASGGLVPGHDGSGPVHLAFGIEEADLAEWEQRLAAMDVPVESRVNWPRGGRSIYFRDPESRSVELATRGTWATY